MNDDALSIVWMSDPPIDKDALASSLEAALEEDRASRHKERWIRRASMAVMVVLCPVLLWCAAYGITPLVRAGYALLAVGTAVVILAEWTYLAWSRAALPGPADARSQLQKTTFMLARQAGLLRTAPLLASPIFVGTALIAVWVYVERSHAAGYLLWAIVGAAWLLSAVNGVSRSRTLDERRSVMERLLSDLE